MSSTLDEMEKQTKVLHVANNVPSLKVPKVVLLFIELAQNSAVGARGRISTREVHDCCCFLNVVSM